jgi:Domain of unknown function DUF11
MRSRLLVAACAAVAALASAPASGAAQAVLRVNDTADLGLSEHPELCGHGKGPLERICTLRAALESAQTFDGTATGADEVLVLLPAGHYALETGRPLPVGDQLGEACEGTAGAGVPCPLTLQGAGAGASVIDGAGATGLLAIAKGAGPVAVAGVTLTGSHSAGGAIEDVEGPAVVVRESLLQGNAGAGAARIERASLAFVGSAIQANSAAGAAVQVGAGSLSLERSSVTGNAGASALAATEGGSVELLDSTVAANSAGTAVVAEPGTSVDLRYSTLDGGAGTALRAADVQSISLEGAILNGAAALACEGQAVVATPVADILHGASPGCTFAGVAPSGADPLLGAPVPNGLLTVLPLLHGSPAANAGGASCPGSAVEGAVLDERGVARPQGAGCDLGAFESAADAAVSLAARPATAGSAFALSATVRDAGGDGLSGTSVTIALPELANLIAAPIGCSASYGAGTVVSCPLGAMAPGATRTVTLQVQPLLAETLALGASVQADQADYDPGDDSASLPVPVANPVPGHPFAALLSRTMRVNRHGNALVRMRCVASGLGTPCATSIALYGPHGPIAARTAPLARRLAGASTIFGAGRTVTVLIHLSKRSLRAIHLRRSANARLVLATGAAPVRRSVLVVKLVRTR